MVEEELEKYIVLLNYIKSHNTVIRLKEKNKIQNKNVKEYAETCNELLKRQKEKNENKLNEKNKEILELKEIIVNLKKENEEYKKRLKK